jgi:crotonobetainyl-CoA:carnitine CoA-transferase CaiB-like acyl-CoA transferase
VLTRAQTLEHPQILANAIIAQMDHPEAGRIRHARPPARFSATPIDPVRPARPLGADTEAVLAEAGFPPAEIAAMIADGVATGPQETDE